MYIYYDYSHLGGKEILQIRFPHLLQEIEEVIQAVQAKRTKRSREKGRKGVYLYDPRSMNRQFQELFRQRAWLEIRDRYPLNLPNYPDKSLLFGAKQIDFAKEGVLVEVQFGKYAFMFYDLAKFQYFYNEAKAEVAVEIVPAKPLQSQMSSGVSYGEQLVHDILRLRRHFPAVPVWIVLIAAEEKV